MVSHALLSVGLGCRIVELPDRKIKQIAIWTLCKVNRIAIYSILESLTMLVKKSAQLLASLLSIGLLMSCTQEQQNKISRDIQNWTGTDGVLEVYAGDKLVRRFLKIDKISTALGTDDGKPRAYRYGYGVLDENLNFVADANEKRVYFEISDYATNYVFFGSPK